MLASSAHTEHSQAVENENDWGLLNQLRFAMLTCRAKPRIDTFDAGAALLASHFRTADQQLHLLLRILYREMKTPPVLFAPGTKPTSFDEDWILRILQCISAKDSDSLYFLIASRTTPSGCRTVSAVFHEVNRMRKVAV